MDIGDLKRAVEDVILKPDDNRLSEMSKRSSIAALDLCQVAQSQGVSVNEDAVSSSDYRSTTPLAYFSCSGDMLSSHTGSTSSTSVTTSSGQPHVEQSSLSMSTSLDTMVLRHALSCRPSLGTMRRSGRVIPHFGRGKRKRSNSVSSCLHKGANGQQGLTLLSSGISSTTTGGASAISLPPTARHTPFRFGDSDDRFYPPVPSNSSMHSPIPSSATVEEQNFFLDSVGTPLSTATDAVSIEAARSNWQTRGLKSDASFDPDLRTTIEENYDFHQNTRPGRLRQTATKSVDRSCDDDTQPEPNAFTQFRQPDNPCNCDNDEQMECD